MVNDQDTRIPAFGMVLYHTGHLDPLFNIQVGAWLIEDIEISIP